MRHKAVQDSLHEPWVDHLPDMSRVVQEKVVHFGPPPLAEPSVQRDIEATFLFARDHRGEISSGQSTQQDLVLPPRVVTMGWNTCCQSQHSVAQERHPYFQPVCRAHDVNFAQALARKLIHDGGIHQFRPFGPSIIEILSRLPGRGELSIQNGGGQIFEAVAGSYLGIDVAHRRPRLRRAAGWVRERHHGGLPGSTLCARTAGRMVQRARPCRACRNHASGPRPRTFRQRAGPPRRARRRGDPGRSASTRAARRDMPG